MILTDEQIKHLVSIFHDIYENIDDFQSWLLNEDIDLKGHPLPDNDLVVIEDLYCMFMLDILTYRGYIDFHLKEYGENILENYSK